MNAVQEKQIEAFLNDVEAAQTEQQLVVVRDAVVARMAEAGAELGASYAAGCGRVIMAIAQHFKVIREGAAAS